MKNLIGDLVKDNMNIDDKIVCESMLSAAKEAADLYLNSTLTSTTPELRAIYAASVVQMIEGHTALTELSVTKGWAKPYETPTSQLSCACNEAKDTVG
ncbi:spore coat protein [uncultured Clostridium sp.]|uniref:spore coat protein n=1 Tax=uncultured Clostridium sp. TaxID=59620 RepID=UPI0025E950AA|nr:spore coat protein [uncultured Clostridium sp.]